jgi:hypothetical protein
LDVCDFAIVGDDAGILLYRSRSTTTLNKGPALRSFSSRVGKLQTPSLAIMRLAMTRNSLSVKMGLVVCLFLLTVFSATPVWAGSHSHSAKQEIPTDPGYVFALAAASHFPHAWQTGDMENGMILLSDGIRQTQNADKLEQFFSTGAERAFEIARGHGHSGLYSFPVVLVALRGSHVTRKASEITLVETGKNDWVVDKLP